MSKKGFTLVELLAVIAILAILVIIALPNVLSMFNSGKESTFLTEVQNVYKTAQNQYLVTAMSGTPTLKYGSATSCTQLDMSGKALSYYVELDAAGNVTTIKVSDGTYSYTNTSSPKIEEITAIDGTYAAVSDAC